MRGGISKTAYMTTMGVAAAAALALSYVETLIPVPMAVPGVKLGLANIVTVFVLFKLGWRAASAVSAVRVALASLLFGTMLSAAYSAAGAVLSVTVMALLKGTKKFTPTGVSVAGAIMHNVGQILMAMMITGVEQIAAWLPMLIVSGLVTGIAVGIAGSVLVKVVKLGKSED